MPKRLTMGIVVAAAIVLLPGTTLQGQPRPRLNRLIDTLDKGRVGCGIVTQSIQDAERFSANPEVDFIFYDMEHSPYDIAALKSFLQSMVNVAEIAKNGNQRRPATLVRIAAYAREMNQWMAKQVLDAGAFGLFLPNTETADQIVNFVRASRYPQPYGVPDFEPDGIRGSGPGAAMRHWGILDVAEYRAKADVWPYDPNGELFISAQVENQLGVDNAPDMFKVKGISSIGPVSFNGDLGLSLRQDKAAYEKAIEAMAEAAKGSNKILACYICTRPDERGPEAVERRIKQGYRMFIELDQCIAARKKMEGKTQ